MALENTSVQSSPPSNRDAALAQPIQQGNRLALGSNSEQSLPPVNRGTLHVTNPSIDSNHSARINGVNPSGESPRSVNRVTGINIYNTIVGDNNSSPRSNR